MEYSKLAINETHNTFRKDIHQTALAFCRRYGGDVGETVAQANLHYMQAYYRYDRRRGANFRTWLRYFIRKQLLEELRSRIKRHRLLPRTCLNLDLAPGHQLRAFDFAEFTAGLSSDARAVVHMACWLRHPDTRTIKTEMRGHLHDFGWTGARINSAFREVRRHLKGNP